MDHGHLEQDGYKETFFAGSLETKSRMDKVKWMELGTTAVYSSWALSCSTPTAVDHFMGSSRISHLQHSDLD